MEKEPEPNKDRKIQNLRSAVWLPFTRIKKGTRAMCNFCKKDYAAIPGKNGTSTLKRHLDNCGKYQNTLADKKQKTLTRVEGGGEGKTADVVPTIYNYEVVRKTIIRMIVIDELPFSFVEGKGFREFMRNACPRFDIPSRRTVTRDVLQLYVDEKAMLKSLFSTNKQRVSITTDTWTSIQNVNYMVITAHFIDVDWVLHKRILGFYVIPNHKGETIGKLIESCLLDWGIERVCTITVDNASENKSAIEYMKKKMSNWKADAMVLAGEFMHLRCCAHIINLIVKEGLKELDESIASIRNAVKYIRSSPSRLEKLKLYAKLEKIDCGRVVVMDVPTRWNSTYLMLETALIFQKAFERMEDDDELYNSYFNESDSGRKREGPPNMVHWNKAKKFVRFLKTFYDVTLKFSATLSVTSNLYFNEICKILSLLNSMSGFGDLELATMATNMKRKFNKYWSSSDQVNKLLIVSVVLDPRQKLDFVQFCFAAFYEPTKAEELGKDIKNLLVTLYDIYNAWSNNSGCSSSGTNGTQNSNIVQLSSQDVTFEVDPNDFLVSFRKLKERKLDIGAQNEVERYLLEPTADPNNKNFDILSWWKLHGTEYPTLSQIARDIFDIPVSTVASESAFSTGGRILYAFRSSLTPKTVEALICTQNWLKSSLLIEERLDESCIEQTQFYERIESEFVKAAPTGATEDQVMVD